MLGPAQRCCKALPAASTSGYAELLLLSKLHLGWWNMILNKPTSEACAETPLSHRSYRDQGMTFPAEALETVLASCSRCNLTYPNWNVWWGGSLCHLSIQAPIQGMRSSQQLPGKPWAASRRLRLAGAKSQNSLVFLGSPEDNLTARAWCNVESYLHTAADWGIYAALLQISANPCKVQIHAKVLLLRVIWSLGDLRQPAVLIRATNLTGQRQDRCTGG